jgi:hypothetical protein
MGWGMGGPGYSATWYPSRPVSGQDANLGIVRQNLSVGAAIWREDGDALMMNFGVLNSLFFTDAVLPDTRRPFPADLWSVNVGLNYMHKFDNGWTGALITGFGSSSDQPFHSINEMNVTLGGMLRIPARNDRDMWTLGVMYNPSGVLNFPIPIASYLWNPSDQFQMSIGLPLAMTWRPTGDWTVNISYTPLTNVNARVTYRMTEALFAYCGYEYLTESYFLAERVNKQDRFFGFEQRLVTGLRWNVWRNTTLDANGGYAFDRHYGEGQNQGASLHDQVFIAPGAFLGVRLAWKF